MIWKDVNEMWPEDGAFIAVLDHHSKNQGYMSCTVHSGRVLYSNDRTEFFVCTEDFTGNGSWGLFPEWANKTYHEDTFKYWAYLKDMPMLPDEYHAKGETSAWYGGWGQRGRRNELD